MKALINCKEREFPDGTKLIEIVNLIREAKKDEPMIVAIKEKTGKDYLTFVVNGNAIKLEQFESLEIKEGDDIRWFHPYFGG